MNKGKRGSQRSDRLVLSGGIVEKIDGGLAVDLPLGIGGEEVLALGQVLGHGPHHLAKRRLRRLAWFWKKEQQPADGFIHMCSLNQLHSDASYTERVAGL